LGMVMASKGIPNNPSDRMDPSVGRVWNSLPLKGVVLGFECHNVRVLALLVIAHSYYRVSITKGYYQQR